MIGTAGCVGAQPHRNIRSRKGGLVQETGERGCGRPEERGHDRVLMPSGG